MMVRRMRNGPLMCPSVTGAEYFSAKFPGDVPTNIKLISRKMLPLLKK